MSFQGFEEAKKDISTGELKPVGRREKREKLLKATNRNEKISELPPGATLTVQESPSKVQLSISESGRCQILPAKTTSLDPAEPSTPIQKDCPVVPENFETPPPDNEPIAISTSSSPISPPPSSHTTSSSKLDEFEAKRKMIEEQNRKRREMLTLAINSRKKATHEETRRLEQAQEELAKIDLMLTSDVKFLRGAIEEASLQFMQAQKRYDRAEKEFVDSKMHLFASLERKELLTDHLCAIIEQNELRKAKKLEELMSDLQLSEDMLPTAGTK